MPAISSTTLTNGSRVDLSTGDIPRDGTYFLTAQLFDAKGALVRTINVDTARNSDGSTSPPRGKSFSNFQVVSLSGGGFAIGYDDTTANAPGGSNQAEIHIYGASGLVDNVQIIGTSNGGEPFPRTGNPVLYATNTNATLVAVRGPDDLIHLTRTDYQIGERTYEVGPSAIYDAGFTGNIVATIPRTQLGNPLPTHIREVIGANFTLVSSSSVFETQGGIEGETLRGGPGADDLYGLGGDDTLTGGDGYDVLYGGAGSDRFVFALDGSVDQAADFDRTTDTLAVVDAAGASIVSSGSILTFYRASGVLTYDPDGGNGPAPAVSVGMLSGVKNLTAANLAPGFEPALVRIVNPVDPAQAPFGQGSHSDITYGFGRTNFIMASADYSPADVLLAYIVDFTDHSRSETRFDQLNQQAWSRLVADFATNGQLAIYATYFDDETHVLWRFDADGSQSYSRIVDHYDAQGRLVTHEVVADDGSHWGATFDVANTQPYGYAVDFFDANGALLAHRLYNDDGSLFT